MTRPLTSALLTAAILIALMVLGGCRDSADSTSTGLDAVPTLDRVDPSGLPELAAGYTGWRQLNAEPIADDPEVPHGGLKDVFASVDEEDGTYPDGALVVKRGSQGDDPAGLVSVMLKVVNGNPQHGDWIFREYVRPRPDAAYTVLAENEACWSCHDGAADTDWVFTKADG